MTTQSALIELLAGIALLIWSTRLVRTGIERALGERLRRIVEGATRGRLGAAATGALIAAALQSGTAAILLASQFARRGLIPLVMALALALGADMGSTVAVKLLSFDIRWLSPVCLIAGFALFSFAPTPALRNSGRALLGVGLVLMALGMIATATTPLKTDALVPIVLQRLESAPLVAVLVAALLTLAVQSSVAVVLLVATLMAAGVISPTLCLLLVLGANAGAALVVLWLLWSGGVVARRLALGNLVFRGSIALALTPLAAEIAPLAGTFTSTGALAADLHIAFNGLVALVWLPLIGPVARWLERMVAAPVDPAESPSHLDEAALTHPSTALAAASREALRIADRIELMLREVMLTFDPRHADRVAALKRVDDEVDRAQEAIKLYLTRLTRQPLSEEDSRKAFDLILFATNLEHVGDIIDKNLLELAQKKHRLQASFSEEGLAELNALHERAVQQARMAVTVFLTRDAEMARQLVAAKDAVRVVERAAAENHLKRLREGRASSIETSSLHLDVLRDLKRIIAHLTNVAHPILEATGQLRRSRLSESAPNS